MAVKLDMSAHAVLVWLPIGETPTQDDFKSSIYSVEEALDRIREAIPDNDTVPWIKTGETILDSHQIAQAQMGLRLMRSHEP
jgi:hypothetical protein